MSRYCLVGVFLVSPCRCDEATFGATRAFPDAYVTPGLDTIDLDGGVATDAGAVFEGVVEEEDVVGIDRPGPPPYAVADAIAADTEDDAAVYDGVELVASPSRIAP